MKYLRTFFAALAIAFAGIVSAPVALAGDAQIDAALAAGTVGERIDGFLGVVSTADASLTRKVNEINNKRRALYEQLANETGTSPAQVARITAEKQIAKLSTGQFFMDESGSWKRK